MAIRRMAQRAGTEEEWLEINPILFEGEFGFIKDRNQIVVGDGFSPFTERPRFEFSGVSSVNGKLGAVELTAEDIGASSTGDLDAHKAAFDADHGADHDARDHSPALSTATATDLPYNNAGSGLSATNVGTAIDELDSDVATHSHGGGGGGSIDAVDVTYSNTTSGLTATDVQAALDEIDSGTTKTTGGGLAAFHSIGNSGATPEVNLANGNFQEVTLDDISPTFTFVGATAGVACEFTLIAKQDATGSRDAQWPASVLWPASDATPTTPSLDPNSINIYRFFTVDGGTTWYGRSLGFDFG